MPGLVASARHRLGALRWRLRPPHDAKGLTELAWWLHTWDPPIREGRLQGPRTLELSGDEAIAGEYLGRRWQQASAEVTRVLEEAEIDDPAFFDGKVVLDIGSGPLGFPDAVVRRARAAIAVEPLTREFQDAGLLLDSDAIYLACGAESIPLRSGSVDVVVSRNNLDHVDDPIAVLSEVKRLLRPGGTVILNVDLDHTPTVTEPHTIALSSLRAWLAPLRIEREIPWDHSHGIDGHAVVIVASRDS